MQNSPAKEQSTTTLVSGIVDDFQKLVKQQLQLTKQEILQDFHKAKEGVWLYTFGIGMLVIAAIPLVFALVHLLHWATSPSGTDPASVPLWGWFAIVGAVLAIAGGVLAWLGETKFQSMNPLDHNPATEAMKENVDWATGQK
jgi:hypothetical protein